MTSAELEALYRRLERPLYNVVYRRVWNTEEAQEIVQDAFVRLWRMRRRVRMDSVDALVYRIALNRASSRLRARRVKRWFPISRVEDPEIELVRKEVQRAINALTDDLRAVLLLTEFSDMTYAQIGEALSIPEGTVGSRRSRALKQLKKDLGNGDEERLAS